MLSMIKPTSLMAAPLPMFAGEENRSDSSTASKSAATTSEAHRRQADLACQADDSLNNNNQMDPICNSIRGEKLSIDETEEPRTSEESIATGKSGEASVKQVPSKIFLPHPSSSFASADSRETPPLEGRISDVTKSSPDSTTSQEGNSLALVSEAHAHSSAIKEAVLKQLREHPSENHVAALLPAYAQLRTLAQEQLAFVKSLPADHPDREEMVFKASEIVSNFLDVALQSSRPSTEEEKKVYLYDDFLPASVDQDYGALYNKQDIRVLQYEFQLAKELLEEKGDQGESLGKRLATVRLDRSWRVQRYVSSKADDTSYQEPYWSNAVTANKTAIKNRKQRFIETGAPIENPIEARRAAIGDILELLEEGFKVGDRQMQF